MNEKDENLELILKPIPPERMHELTKAELIVLLKGEQELRAFFEEKAREQEALAYKFKEEVITVENKLIKIKHLFFGKSTERCAKEKRPNLPPPKKKRKKRDNLNRLPSKRYPNVPLVEKDIDFVTPPVCSCCNADMIDSGMSEDSEYLTVIPKKYIIVRQKRRKYRCKKCHGSIETAPALPRIRQGSSYSDEMIIDASLSKYCDLLPIERYAQMAAREGFVGLPQQSLIQSSHYLAKFVMQAYNLLREEICSEKVLMADETPHRMLEGDKKSNWFLWGFSGKKTCYFEYHDTRAGAVATKILIEAECTVLVSDVYSGYSKAIKDSNFERKKQGRPLVQSAYCNAHARRKFKQAERKFPESSIYVEKYKEIYALEEDFKNTSNLLQRKKMKEIFISLKNMAVKDKDCFSSKSEMGIGLNYFIKNYNGLTLFIDNPEIPIDNNGQERLLRSPVVGRKTWYGTHSIKGAKTAAILFSLVESCKLNKVNPREYFRKLVEDLHQKKEAYTPMKFAEYPSSLSPP